MEIRHGPLFNWVLIVSFPHCCCFLLPKFGFPESCFFPPAALRAEFPFFDNSPSLHPPARMCLCLSPPYMRLCSCSQQLWHTSGFDSVACGTEPELVYSLSYWNCSLTVRAGSPLTDIHPSVYKWFYMHCSHLHCVTVTIKPGRIQAPPLIVDLDWIIAPSSFSFCNWQEDWDRCKLRKK